VREKGGKHNRVPAHHKAAEYLEKYLDAGGIGEEREGPLFRTVRGRQRSLQLKPMSRIDVFRMIERRAQDAGLPPEVCFHTFRATGITNYLQHGGTIETAAQIAGHESTRTTQLYDRADDEVTLDEIERIRI
jgi:integrase/recombinase XerD